MCSKCTAVECLKSPMAAAVQLPSGRAGANILIVSHFRSIFLSKYDGDYFKLKYVKTELKEQCRY
jgi:hypothetical protein